MNLVSELRVPGDVLRPTLYIKNLPKNSIHFLDLQPRAVSALRHFLKKERRNLLILKADDQYQYAKLLEFYLQTERSVVPVCGVNYVIEQADSFSFPKILAFPATSTEDNFAAKKTVLAKLHTDSQQLFGSLRIHKSSNDLQLNAGLVHQLNQGVLILSVNNLLSQFDLWLRLKQILLTETFEWYSTHPFKSLPCDIPSYPLSLKVILLGNREELAAFSECEPDLFQLADYAEIESYLALETEQQQKKWAAYVQSFATQNNYPKLSLDGLNRLYQGLVRESEDCWLINFSPSKLAEILSGATCFATRDLLSAVEFEQFFIQQQYQQSFLREQTYRDILQSQVYVATDGEVVGQINGLSVIEYNGTPLSFGEPSRISCVVQFGDGEIIDVERKNELAGNIHGKGMMIAEACLTNLLDFQSQLPFSASLVFEQSYSDIDGDSASLAIFCVLLSALADLPLPQSIAVTGAIDQFGLVHSVGGVNDKIEGFFAICQARGLTKEQGVIIPTAVLNQLSLSQELISAVEKREFSLWAVENVDQACEILFQRDLIEQEETYNENNKPISHYIMQRLEQRSEPLGWKQKWFALMNFLQNRN